MIFYLSLQLQSSSCFIAGGGNSARGKSGQHRAPYYLTGRQFLMGLTASATENNRHF